MSFDADTRHTFGAFDDGANPRGESGVPVAVPLKRWKRIGYVIRVTNSIHVSRMENIMNEMNTAMKEEIQKQLAASNQADPIIIDAIKCVPYITCFFCNNLQRCVVDRHVMFYGDLFLIKTCTRCTGADREISTASHTEQYYRGRRLCYHGVGNGGRTTYDIASDLAALYRAEYKAADDAREEEAKRAADAAKAEANRIAKAEADRIEAARVRQEQAVREAAKAAAKAAAKKARAEALKPLQQIPDIELYRSANWEDIGNQDFIEIISDKNFTADIKGVVSLVSEAVKAYTGNMVSLGDLIGKLDLKFRQFKTYENQEDSHVQVKEDEEGRIFFMKFTYTFLSDEVTEHCCFMDCTKIVKKIRSRLVVMRPKDDNLEATEICRRMMNEMAISVIEGTRYS